MAEIDSMVLRQDSAVGIEEIIPTSEVVMGTTLRVIHRKKFKQLSMAELLELVPDGVEVGDVWLTPETQKDGSLALVVSFSEEREKKKS